jgi:ketosteroid isomerase-like protein
VTPECQQRFAASARSCTFTLPLRALRKCTTLKENHREENKVPNAESAAVTAWLSTFEAALSKSDARAATALFADECYWRDLVSFTWNIITLEGRAAIESMLAETLATVKPSNWKIESEAKAADGVIEGWFTFETAVSRGRGIVRLKDSKCWTLLTTMVELKGFEERKGPKRIMGAEHGVAKNRKSWLQLKQEEDHWRRPRRHCFGCAHEASGGAHHYRGKKRAAWR